MTLKLTEAERAQVRYHMGYPNVEPVSSIQLGVPAVGQALFLVEIGMDRLLPEAVGKVMQIVSALDEIECQMLEALRRLKAQSLGEMKLRNSNEEPTEQDLLENEYRRWAQRLSSLIGAPLNTFSERFAGLGAGGGMNIPVWHPGR